MHTDIMLASKSEKLKAMQPARRGGMLQCQTHAALCGIVHSKLKREKCKMRQSLEFLSDKCYHTCKKKRISILFLRGFITADRLFAG